MDKAQILDDCTVLIRDIFAREDIVVSPQTTAADVTGWDSMKQIEINIAVEEKYGIRLTSREVDRMHSVGDLIEIIAQKVR